MAYQNISKAVFEPGRDLTVIAVGAIRGKTFLNLAAGATNRSEPKAQTASVGGASVGVAAYDAAEGQRTGLKVQGVYPVTAGADIAGGQDVAVGENGYAVPAADTALIVGRATFGAAEGADVDVFLISK